MPSVLRFALENAVLVSVLAVPATAAGLLLRRQPAWVHGLWLLLLIKLVAPPLWRVPLDLPAALGVGPQAAVTEPGPEEMLTAFTDVEAILDEEAADPVRVIGAGTPMAEEDAPAGIGRVVGERFWQALGWAWGSGAALVMALALVRIRRFQRVLALATKAPVALVDRVEELAEGVGLARPPEPEESPVPTARRTPPGPPSRTSASIPTRPRSSPSPEAPTTPPPADALAGAPGRPADRS